MLFRRITRQSASGRWVGGIVCGMVATVTLVTLPSPAAAKPGMVVAQGNQVYEGDVDETAVPGKVVITTKGGIKTTISRQIVEKVTYYGTPRDEFDARIARLKADDVAGRLAVAQWAMDARQLDLAREALEAAKAIEPANAEAASALERVNKQIATTRPAAETRPAVKSPDGVVKPDVGVKPATGTKPGRGGLPIRQVTPQEINSIKQQEWRANDKTVRAQVPPDLRKKFLDLGVVPAKDVTNPKDLAMAILQHGTPAMRDEVVIQTDPIPVADFRLKVEKIFQQSCIQCHTVGKVAAGNNFALYTPNTDADVYSNFVTVQQFTKTVDGVEYSMIDRLRPDASLLAQFALPPDLAAIPHPKVKGYVGAVKNKTDVKYQQLVAWVQGMSPLPPDYGVDLSSEAKPRPGKATGEGGAGAGPSPVVPPRAPEPRAGPLAPAAGAAPAAAGGR